MDLYLSWVREQPLLSAALQFMLLGTLGELLPWWLGAKGGGRRWMPWKTRLLAGKLLAWALLGLLIKFGFTMMRGAQEGLVLHGLLPAACGTGLAGAFTLSVLTNLFFGPQMMAFHRLEDNWLQGEKGFAGIEKAWATLAWFWIPAHTLTFLLPKDAQIGLAALWSVVLGVILGLSTRR